METPETNISPEMRIYSPAGDRLYLDRQERAAFLEAAIMNTTPAERMFCQLLHDTGCRPSEARELTAKSVLLDGGGITFRTLKKRKEDARCRAKLPQYRTVPVSDRLLESFDLVFSIRQRQKDIRASNELLWPMARATAYRLIKRVMTAAGISGPQASPKGLRHGFGVAMITAAQPVPLHLLSKAMGHSSPKTTEIYLQAVGQEEHQLFMAAWKNNSY